MKEYPIGRTIKAVRFMTNSEMEEMGWEANAHSGSRPAVIELDDGSILFPSSDEEMNGAGCLMTLDSKLNLFQIIAHGNGK